MQKTRPTLFHRLLIILAVLATGSGVVWALARNQESQDYWPTEGWRTSAPEEQSLEPAALARMMDKIDEHDMAIDSVVVVRNGRIVFEQYRNGYDAGAKHHLQSTTKSVTSILVGIAMQQGLIQSVDQKVVDFFPDLSIANLDGRKQDLTLEHLLTMSAGMDWHEWDYPYTDERNTLRQMWYSKDAVQYVLDRPMVHEPGEVWAYNSGTSILLGGIIEQVSGQDLLSFAREHLFDPLGIQDVRWDKTTGDHYHSDGGLYLTPRDMARLGYLMLENGTWEGRQLVPAGWVVQATRAHLQTTSGSGYGYQWWTVPVLGGYMATGHHEQRIYVLPAADMVVVFTGNVADHEPQPTDTLLYRYLLAACTDLPAGTLTRSYDRYGFSLVYPVEFSVQEAPIPGRDSLSDASGMTQFSLSFYPTEILNITWDTVSANIDIRQYVEDLRLSVSQQTGIHYDTGPFSEAAQGDHPMLLQSFQSAAQDYSFSGITGAWYCDESERVYVVNYATSAEMPETDLMETFQGQLGAIVCHHPRKVD